MKKVIIKFAMFSIPQKVYVEDEQGKISKYVMPLDKIAEFISMLNCSEVYLYGAKAFGIKLEREVRTKFDKNEILWYYNNREKIQEIVKKAGLDN